MLKRMLLRFWASVLMYLGFVPTAPVYRPGHRISRMRRFLFRCVGRLAGVRGPLSIWGGRGILYPDGTILPMFAGAADAVTTTGSLTTDQAMYEMRAYWSLRPELNYDDVATVKPENVDKPGSSVIWTTNSDLAAATTPLSETVDVDAVALSDSQTTLTLNEYGNAVLTTAKLRATSFADIDDQAAEAIGYNAGLSVDTLARSIVQAGTNVRFAGGVAGRTSIGTGNVLTAALVRRTNAELKSANVKPIGGSFIAFIQPDVAYDLRGETGAAAWRDPHTYSQPEEIWNAEVGKFEGFRFMEFSRAPLFADASDGAGGAGAIDVYGTLFMGAEAVAKAWAKKEGNGPSPRIVLSPVTDKLRRFVAVGWYWFGAYGVFRQAALRRVESASSIGANT